MKVQWNRGFITIRLNTPKFESTVPAYIKEGLAVSRGDGNKGCWRITHIESGLCLVPFFATKGEAVAKADQALCIEGLWDNPLEAFANGLRAVDANRLNKIFETDHFKPHRVSDITKREIARRATMA